MQGIGELFGSAFDDVIRRPTPVLVPIIVDVLVVLVGAIVYASTLNAPYYGAAPRALTEMPLAVPEALPSVTQLRDPTGLVLAEGTRAVLAVVAVTLVTLPVIAYAQSGFVGLLLETYLPLKDDPLAERPESLDDLKDAFFRHAGQHFFPMLVLRGFQSVIAVAAVVLPETLPFFENSLLGLIAFNFLFLFAPFIVVVERKRALRAMRESFRTVTDYLASSLVALLFGLLIFGGFAAILQLIVRYTGDVGAVAGAALLAPLGTVLTLFYLKVYLTLRPGERLPRLVEPAATHTTTTADV